MNGGGLRSRLRSWSWLLGSLRAARGKLVGATLAVVADGVLTLCRPWPVKVVIDRVLMSSHRALRVPFIGPWLDRLGPDRTQFLLGACVASVIVGVGTGVFTYAYTRGMGDVGRHMAFQLRRDLFAHLQRLSLRFHDSRRTGDLTVRLTNDIQSVQEVIASSISVFATNALLLVGMLFVMLWLDWRFALVALSLSPLLLLAVFRYTGRIRVAARAARSSNGALAAFTQETLAAIRIVQGLGRERFQDRRFEAQNRVSLDASLLGIRYQARIAPLVDILAGGGLALVMWYGAACVAAGRVTTGDVVVFFAYVTNLYAPMRVLARLSGSMSRAIVGAERIGEILAIEHEVRDKPGAIEMSLSGAITFDGVSFGYDSAHPVLHDVSFRVAPGERVAIVGASGAGKSTLVSLLARLYDPTGGTIRADGVDIRELSLGSLREQTSLVLQEALLFSGTVADNIGFGRPAASGADIERAARVAGADEFIRGLPDGYASAIGERGVTLSGGQRQRLSIARALLADRPLLLLDEATSSLDAASERMVQQALEALERGRTTLVVAHRLATVRTADRIVVMDRGAIVAQGTHDALMKQGGLYASLAALQFLDAGPRRFERAA